MVKTQPKNPRLIFVSRYHPDKQAIIKFGRSGKLDKSAPQKILDLMGNSPPYSLFHFNEHGDSDDINQQQFDYINEGNPNLLISDFDHLANDQFNSMLPVEIDTSYADQTGIETYDLSTDLKYSFIDGEDTDSQSTSPPSSPNLD